MKALRWSGGALLWVVAVLGALSGALFLGHLAGWVQPLVVVSGSMQPAIQRGDLLIAVPAAVTDVDVGEVSTLPSESPIRARTATASGIATAGRARMSTMCPTAGMVSMGCSTVPAPSTRYGFGSRAWLASPAISIR